jgi:hypothetical protein
MQQDARSPSIVREIAVQLPRVWNLIYPDTNGRKTRIESEEDGKPPLHKPRLPNPKHRSTLKGTEVEESERE